MDFENKIVFAENIINQETHFKVNIEERHNTARAECDIL